MRKRLYFSHVIMVGLIAVILALSATLMYHLRDLLLSPDRISSVAGPQEGYYWTAAQYQIAYLQFRNQVNLYASGVDQDAGMLKLRHDILQSKFKVLAYPSELTHFFREIPSYDPSIHALKDVMRRLERDMRLALHEPRSAHMLIEDMQDGWRPPLPMTHVLPKCNTANKYFLIFMRSGESYSSMVRFYWFWL
jgi:hypothetical protein